MSLSSLMSFLVLFFYKNGKGVNGIGMGSKGFFGEGLRTFEKRRKGR